MKTKLVFVLVLWGASAGASSELFACGNKFLVASRGTRFGRVPAAREQANILVYANPASPLRQVIWDVWVESILNQAGYQPTVVADANELDLALRQGGWDLVLADLADSETLRGQLQGIDAPTVVPVLHEPTRSDMAQAKRDYGRAVKSPFKSQRFLRTIDDAVLTRAD